jgi:hypothetical protein
MRLWRVLPFDPSAEVDQPGGPLWSPREHQGTGRHDNPSLYGCLYLAADPVAAVAEPLNEFRGTGQLTALMLTRLGLPLALAELELSDDATVVDLDDPVFLTERELRPSRIATRIRELTQGTAADMYVEFPDVVGLRWWSTLEAIWINWTLFHDRAAPLLELVEVNELRLDEPVVRDAAVAIGLNP